MTGAPVKAQEYVGTPGGNDREVIVKQGGNTEDLSVLVLFSAQGLFCYRLGVEEDGTHY